MHRRGRGVIHVDVVIRGEIGVEGHPEQAALAEELTLNETKGVGRSTPSLMTRSWPLCSQTKSRPSGANCMAVGFASHCHQRFAEARRQRRRGHRACDREQESQKAEGSTTLQPPLVLIRCAPE